jgi:hypothetical protein
MANKEFFITKLSFRETERLISDVFAYEYDGNTLADGEVRQRHWLVNRAGEGSMISILTPNPDNAGNWIRGNMFTYTNGFFSWGMALPENTTKRKTFVSYYHHDNQNDRTKFENLFGDLIVSKSVEDGDIDSDNSDEYIKQLIQKDFLFDTTVLVVLVGPKTRCRKHIDWEISGALNKKVGDNYAGLLGIILPDHPNFGTGKVTYDLMPPRLSDNFKTGYAIVRDWTDDRAKMQSYIEKAFGNRTLMADKRINSRIQMEKDSCE